jgi:hypothetical protein
MGKSKKLWLLSGSLSLVFVILVACNAGSVEGLPIGFRIDGGEKNTSQVDFPLALGNTWVYSGTFYQGSNPTTILTATYVVTESVVDILHSDLGEYTIIQIARDENLRSCPTEWQTRPDNWCDRLAIYEPEYYWYVIDGATLYRQELLASHRLFERGNRELLFPIAEGAQWYINHTMAQAHPNYDVNSMLRKVISEGAYTIPAGDFEKCFQMMTVIGGNTSLLHYCPEVGFVERSNIHHGTPFGTHEVLIAYTFPQ